MCEEKNGAAYAEMRRIIGDPAERKLLVISGRSGAGKTRLLREMGEIIKREKPGSTVRVTSAQAEVERVLEEIRNGKLDRSARHVDWLLIDDFQELFGKPDTMREILSAADSAALCAPDGLGGAKGLREFLDGSFDMISAVELPSGS